MRSRLAIGFYLAVTLLPVLAGLGYSLLYSLGMAGLLGKGFTLEYWARLFQDPEAWWSILYTGMLSLFSMVLAVAPALAVAYLLHFKASSKGLYRMLFVPLSLPPLIAAFAIYHLLSPAGFASRLAYHAGLTAAVEDFPRLVNDAGSMGILATHMLLLFPFFTLVFLNLSRKENMSSLRGIGQTLGAHEGQFLRRVWLPLLLWRSAPLLLLYSVFLLGAYEVPLLLGRSSPRVVSVYVVEQVSRYDLGGIPVGHAMAVLYALVVGLLCTLFLLRKNRGATA
jgi:putative spermidine/putrescine transport system permease protein